jgi:sphingolipid delta-4 desaturase
MKAFTDFPVGPASPPHPGRARQILAAHPEIRQLIGRRNPWTFAIIAGCVLLQVALAYFLRDARWVHILAVAYLVGAFASHTLFVCLHDAIHHLIFKTRRANLWAAVACNLPTVLPTALTFRHYHLKHHSHLGVPEMDADVPSRWEAKLIGSYSLGKSLWLFFFPVFQALRTIRLRDVKAYDRWTYTNIAVQIAFTGLIWGFMGERALGYLFASFWFSVGLHPLGARWVQEHWLTLDEHQETNSYYGPLNWVNLNIGYHNEHHDFPAVPWNLLPEIKRMAPEFYDTLYTHRSLTEVFFRFIFEQEINLWARMTRPKPVSRCADMEEETVAPESALTQRH